MDTKAKIVGLVVFAVGSGCRAPMECPPGRERLGTHCELLEQDASAAMTDDEAQGDGGVAPQDEEDKPFPDREDAGTQPVGELQTCLVDEDRDGFGVSLMGPSCAANEAPSGTEPGDCDDEDPESHPLATDSCDNGHDDDCDGESDEGGAEICNGVDDDCDGVIENGFACAIGAGVSCTTECGTTGHGTCTDQCSLPAAAACTPPAEICNWKDDDCDGIADPGMLVAKSPMEFKSAFGNPTSVAMVPLDKGQGSWLITLNVPSGQSAGWVRFRKVNSQGQVQAEATQLFAGMFDFRATRSGNWLALLVLSANDVTDTNLNNDATSVQVILLKADTLDIVSRTQLMATQDPADATTLDDYSCDSLWVSDISLFEDVLGVPHVSSIFGYVNGTPGPSGFCEVQQGETAGSYLWRSKYAGSSWVLPVTMPLTRLPKGQALFGPATFDAVERMPCRDEWLVRTTLDDKTQVLRKVPLVGNEATELYRFEAQNISSEFFLGEVDCASPQTSVLLQRQPTGSTASEVREFTLKHADGSLSEVAGTQTSVEGIVYDATQSGGRWFTAGVTMAQTALVRLHEVNPAKSPKAISLAGQPSSFNPLTAAMGRQPVALAASDSAVTLVVAKGTTATPPQAHVLGCP